MSFIAGIVRHDSLEIPDDWIAALADTAGCAVQTLHRGNDAVFLAGPDGLRACSPDQLALCDGDVAAADINGCADAAAVPCLDDIASAHWTDAARRLILSRSHLGTRPLFYVEQGSFFAFASTLPALLALPCVSRALDAGAIARALCQDGTGPANDTYYADVRRVPGGHVLTLEAGTLALSRLPALWDAVPEPRSDEAGDPADTLRALLISAVERQLDDGKTIAVHLSGGLDSATIACIAARRLKQQGRRLIALCSVLPPGHVGPETDERRFIEAVLAQEDTIDPVWVTLPHEADPLGALPRAFECLGEPHYSNVSHAEEMLGNAGRTHGVDVVLSGFGGDFFVSAHGIPTAELHLRRGRIGAALAELRRQHRVHGTGWWPLLRDNVVRPLARWRYVFQPAPETCAAPALVRRVAEREGRRPAASIAKIRPLPHQEMDHLLVPGHLERVLPGMRQIFAQCHGQDLRFPLLDPRLIALLRNLPETELHRDGQTRSVMRRATVGIVPELVRLRPDKGPAFDPALAAHCAAARPALRRWAEQAAPACWDYVDRSRFLAALDTIRPSDRTGWQRDMFAIVLTGGRFAKFIDWHARQQGPRA